MPSLFIFLHSSAKDVCTYERMDRETYTLATYNNMGGRMSVCVDAFKSKVVVSDSLLVRM